MSQPNFDEAAQRELSKFLEAEQAKARLQQSIHTFCDLAFDKCVTKIGMSAVVVLFFFFRCSIS